MRALRYRTAGAPSITRRPLPAGSDRVELSLVLRPGCLARAPGTLVRQPEMKNTTPPLSATGSALRVLAALYLIGTLAGVSCQCERRAARRDPVPLAALPDAEPMPPALAARIQAALAARASRDAAPAVPSHTRHRNPDGSPTYTNRLILEPSPYLLQHAHNPVDWYPWGEEAFAAARRLGRPVLLSVGYSACHWCHVMEEESFEDPEIAAYLNRHYIAIKVDREERPDVDALYMNAVMLMTGRGGWPMTVWLTPEGEPFFGGTYFPPRVGVRGSRVGFFELLQQMAQSFESDPDGVAHSAAKLARSVRESLAAREPGDFTREDAVLVMETAAGAFESHFDAQSGGVRGAPKYPTSLPVRFLLRYHRRTGQDSFLHMATRTLEAMAAGGIYDHLGGGFHRYATDARWLVPHFEKMLYDNALLVPMYLEAYQASGRDDFAAVARDVLAYLARDMRAPGGGYYAATDADSIAADGVSADGVSADGDAPGRRQEGAFFTWTPAELAAALPPDQAALAMALYDVTEAGEVDGRSVLARTRPLAEAAAHAGMSEDQARALVPGIRQTLLRARAQRPPPLRDEKILTDWNGLMISALARAAMVLGEPAYLEQATRTAGFVLSALRRDGRLLRSYMDGEAYIPGYLTDYALLTAGLLDLFEASGDVRWLDEAVALDRVLRERFEDQERGGFFFTSAAHGTLLTRQKPNYDGTIPSGNSVAALNLLRLHAITGDHAYLARAEALFAGLASVMLEDPARMSALLLALDFWTDAPREIVVVAPRARAEAAPFLAVLGRTYVPSAVVIVTTEAEVRGALGERVPLLRGKSAQDGQVTAYVCERGRCELPTQDPRVFARQIERAAPLP